MGRRGRPSYGMLSSLLLLVRAAAQSKPPAQAPPLLPPLSVGQSHLDARPRPKLPPDATTASTAFRKACPAGRYDTATRATVNCACCPPGKYAPQPGALHCLVCPKGRFSPPTVRCPHLMLLGSGLPAGPTGCNRCAAGTFSSKEGGVICAPCPAGKFSDAVTTRCALCMAGYARARNGGAVCTLPARPPPLFLAVPNTSRLGSTSATLAHTGRVEQLSTKAPTPTPIPQPGLRFAQRSNSSLAASLPMQSKVLFLETWWSRKLGLSPALLVLCALCVAALCGAALMHLCDPCSRASRNNTSLDQPVVPMASIASVPKASTCATDDWDGLLANDDEAVPFASTTASSSFNTMPQIGHGYVPEPEPDDDHCDSV